MTGVLLTSSGPGARMLAVAPQVVGDAALLTLLVVFGALIGGRLRPRLVSRAAASLVVGLAVLVTAGMLFLVVVALTGRTLPALGILVTAVGLAVWAFWSRGGGSAELRDVAAQALVTAPVFAACSALVRAQDTRVVFSDVTAFLASAATIARGRSDLLLSEATTFYSFPPGAKVTHALTFLYDPAGYGGLATGAGGLRPLGLVLLAAIAVLMGSAVRQLTATGPLWQSRALAVAAPLALLSIERVVFISHLNGSHAPVAAALLLLAVLLLDVGARPGQAVPGGVRWAAALLVALVVLHRWEGLLIVPLVLLPAYRLDVARRLLAGLWQTVGATVVVWSFAALMPYRGAEAVVRWAGDPVRSLTVMIAAGLVLYVAGTVSRSVPERLLGAVPALGAAAVWLGVAAFARLDRPGFVRSLSATATNLLPFGSPAMGGWRWSGVALVGVALLVAASRLVDRRPELGLFSYPALLFFPAMLIAAFVREGGYRVGFPDSLNRSWLHILPLLLVALASRGLWSRPDADGPITARGVPNAEPDVVLE
jgi:hypothetical protein